MTSSSSLSSSEESKIGSVFWRATPEGPGVALRCEDDAAGCGTEKHITAQTSQ